MSSPTGTSIGALELGRAFFLEVVRPAMERICPEVLARAACGRFGWGSECLGMDDAISRDHHWGPRIDILLPEEVFRLEGERILRDVGAALPGRFRGFHLEAGHVGSAGLSPESRDSFLQRTIGRTSAPRTLFVWLEMPEEDILHVVNGEVWHDPSGEFTALRKALRGYYPDPVWKLRIAQWCRNASGYGLYHMTRAVQRDNLPFLHHAFAQTVRYTMHLVFLLNRTFYPYDKWLAPMFRRLPRLAPEMGPLIDEACQSGESWDRRVQLCERMHEIVDEHMVKEGLVPSHQRFKRSATSGYRLLEWAYREILTALPSEILTRVPIQQQKYMDIFVAGFTAGQTREAWEGMLRLEPEEVA